MEFHPLSAPGLVLDSFREADVDRVFQICQDPEIPRWTPIPSPYFREDAVDFISGYLAEGWQTGKVLGWAVRALAADAGERLVAHVVLKNVTAESAEVGYWVAAEARGKGVAQSAVRAVLDWALSPDGLGLELVTWEAWEGNVASRKVAERVGFRIEEACRSELDPERDSWSGSILSGEVI
jgi:RimJ/RimL family protein N-acetyltransferase